MHLCDLIKQTLQGTLDEESLSPDDRAMRVYALSHEYGWEFVRDCLMWEILMNDAYKEYWYYGAVIFWEALHEQEAIPRNDLIAILYRNLDRCYGGRPTVDDDKYDAWARHENLVWSITIALKGVSYLSDYDPLKDPEIVEAMKKLER